VTIENTDSFNLARQPIRLGSQLVVNLGTEAVKMVSTIILRDIGTHLKGLRIFQENDRTRDWNSFIADHRALYGSRSSGILADDGWLRLRNAARRGIKKQTQREETL